MEAIKEILKTTTAKKMIASLSVSKSMDKSFLSENNWVNELPLQQQELFDCIYNLLNLTRSELAFKLINQEPIF